MGPVPWDLVFLVAGVWFIGWIGFCAWADARYERKCAENEGEMHRYFEGRRGEPR